MTASLLTTAPSLSTRMREESHAAHMSAESSTFVSELMKGELNADAWALLLAQYAPFYEALEEASDRLRGQRADLDALLEPGLDRTARIRHDLTALSELTGRPQHAPVEAALVYADRIRAVSDEPARFIAHHYTRYLGDLSGGQAMGALIGRSYDVPAEARTFFSFDDIKGPVFKRSYRSHLDALVFTEAERDAAVEETLWAFAQNERVFAEVDARWRSLNN